MFNVLKMKQKFNAMGGRTAFAKIKLMTHLYKIYVIPGNNTTKQTKIQTE